MPFNLKLYPFIRRRNCLRLHGKSRLGLQIAPFSQARGGNKDRCGGREEAGGHGRALPGSGRGSMSFGEFPPWPMDEPKSLK